jgi:two-component system, NtrC family, sensor kinase
MRPLFCILYFVLLNSSAFSQIASYNSGVLIDSLKLEIEQTTSDSLKSEYYLLLVNLTQSRNPDSAIYFGKKAFELAQKIGHTPVQVVAMGLMSHAYRNKGNLPKAVEIALQAIELGKDLPIRGAGGVGPSYSSLGNTYLQIGDYERASIFLYKLIGLGQNDKLGIAYGHYYLASLYEKQNKLDSAQYHLDKCYEEFKTVKFGPYPEVYDVFPPWYNLRATIYLKNGMGQLALSDYFHGLEMTLRNDEPFFSSATYNEIALYYKQKNQADSVIYYAEKGLIEAKKLSTQKEILISSEILSEFYEKQNPAKALAYLKLANETRNTFYSAGNMQVMRDLIEQNDKKQAQIEADDKANKNRFFIIGILSAAIIFLITAILLFRNNQTKQRAKLKIESAFHQLKSTQAQLIQSEKMASLGELTAGIAHEIQNPLNFVNNFSEVSEELVKEIKEERLKTKDERNEALEDEILTDIEQNLQKINHHGNRASSIVKGMLEHSRTSSSQKELTDINALADEYFRLSYHGLRAKDKDFNAEMVTDLDPKLPKIEVVSQDIGRVLLNLINNAFQACIEKASMPEAATEHGRSALEGRVGEASRASASENYKPAVTISTSQELTANSQKQIAITIKDNGPGIPDAIKDKIFQPFFTTKDTGKGMGLGLSLAYDIVKAHGGEMRVESVEGEGAAFIINLPLKA